MNLTRRQGLEIAWSQWGVEGARPVILLHSLGSDHGMWAPQIETLSKRHAVIAIDTRGHGASSAPPGAYSLQDLCTDVLAVADDIGADRFHVVGLSLGGQMALWLAAHHPERVISMTASNTGAKIGTDESWSARILEVETNGMAAIRPAVVERWFSVDFADRHAQWFREACDTFDMTDPKGYAGCCHALAGADLRQNMATLSVPTLIIGSDQDVSTPPEQAQYLATQIDGARLVIIEGAGHLSNLDRRPDFDRALTDFLDSM